MIQSFVNSNVDREVGIWLECSSYVFASSVLPPEMPSLHFADMHLMPTGEASSVDLFSWSEESLGGVAVAL